MVVGSQIAILNLLADLNLAVQYGIAIHIILYASKKFWRILIWQLLKQTAKFSGYTVHTVYVGACIFLPVREGMIWHESHFAIGVP